MLNAEKFSSLAWIDGAAYPGDALNEGWKKVLFNQFHDLAAGSGIGVIYQDAQRRLRRGPLDTHEDAAAGAFTGSRARSIQKHRPAFRLWS